jgi:hypothetical protein
LKSGTADVNAEGCRSNCQRNLRWFHCVPRQKNCRGIAEANSKIIKRLRQLFAEAKIVEFRGLLLNVFSDKNSFFPTFPDKNLHGSKNLIVDLISSYIYLNNLLKHIWSFKDTNLRPLLIQLPWRCSKTNHCSISFYET